MDIKTYKQDDLKVIYNENEYDKRSESKNAFIITLFPLIAITLIIPIGVYIETKLGIMIGMLFICIAITIVMFLAYILIDKYEHKYKSQYFLSYIKNIRHIQLGWFNNKILFCIETKDHNNKFHSINSLFGLKEGEYSIEDYSDHSKNINITVDFNSKGKVKFIIKNKENSN